MGGSITDYISRPRFINGKLTKETRPLLLLHGRWLRPEGQTVSVGVSVIDKHLAEHGPTRILRRDKKGNWLTIESGLYCLESERQSGRMVYRIGTREEIIAMDPSLIVGTQARML